MDSKIIKILIVGLTTVLALTTFSENDFFKYAKESNSRVKSVTI